MKKIIFFIAFSGLLATTQAGAVPALQVGAPAGAGDAGLYADYKANSTNPTENDTAITSGVTLLVAGVFGPKTTALGRKDSTGPDWSAFSRPNEFNGHGAILVVSVPDTTLAAALATLKVGDNFAFYSNEANDYFPNSHAPVQDAIADFLFFDIGNFSNISTVVPDFKTETDFANGEIKTLTITGFGSVSWSHFDVMALKTDNNGTSIAFNPGSHDLTDPPSGGGSSGQASSGNPIPEPGMLALLSVGLLGQALLIRQRRRHQKKII